MKELNEEVDNSLINIGASGNVDFGGNPIDVNTDPIEIHEVSGSTFYGTMMIVKDPSRVSLATIYPWRTEGVTLDELVKSAGAIGGIFSPLFARLFRITDPVAEGVAIGASSHAIGTSKALEIGQLQGAMSSIAICICGILTSIIVLFIPA